jgi:hypothetical protein
LCLLWLGWLGCFFCLCAITVDLEKNVTNRAYIVITKVDLSDFA